jgi:hypothetical protein
MKADKELDPYFYRIGWIFLTIGALYALIYFGFRINLLQKLPLCAFHVATGYYCPGCGGSRAVVLLLRGRLLRSLYYHPFVLYCVVIGGWFMVSQSIERLTRGRWQIGMHYRNIYLWIALALILLNCMIKNAVLAFTGVPLMG